MNIQFEYRYRDFGNFKNYNSVVFGNEKNFPAGEIDRIISHVLGDDRTFEATRFDVPEMFFKHFLYNPELDWRMHEYLSVSETDLPVSDARRRDVSDLLSHMAACSI